MPHDCVVAPNGPAGLDRYRKILWLVLCLNAAMFAVEIIGGLIAGSMALQADSLDFLGDAANYGISLMVLGGSLRVRASAAFLKGVTMAGFGVYVLAASAYRAFVLGLPDALIMTAVGILALAVNVLAAILLYAYREGDANMRSVWLCSRNDALANVAVLVAAGLVAVTGTAWADLAVAAVIAALATSGGLTVIRQAMGEIRSTQSII